MLLTRQQRWARSALAVTITTAALALAGCSTIGNSASTGTATQSSADSALLKTGYAGAFDAPPASGPAAQKGKNVWYISCGQTYVACANSAIAFKQAGKALGWNVTTIDGKADPNTAATEIKQAIAAHVDGVALFTYDCPGIKSALLAAKAANMPVVNYGSIDCDDAGFGSGDALFAASVNEQGSSNQADMWGVLGKARADYVTAKVGSAGGKIIDINETSQRAHVYQQKAFVAELGSKCPKCQMVNVPFTFSQVPTAATAIWKAALLANPDAKAITWDTDALMFDGLSTAIQQSSFRTSSVPKIGAEGNLPNMDLIRNGQQTSSSFIPYSWYQWGAADTLNRLFAGESASNLPSEGGGFMYIDKTHNLPASGKEPKLPIDYQAEYKKVWDK